jgi:excinuclease ABC subunit A
MPQEFIRVHGARQNNLKNLSLDIPTGELVVVTGVSGSGKSSLVFDTLYAEGQRRYVETFSPYARQFLDRQDRPQVDAIEGIPPAIAIDQTNPVRTSRSTVGTMTELNDHLKLLYARAAKLYCRGCGQLVRRDTPDSIYADLQKRSAQAGDPRLIVVFPVNVPANFSEAEVKQLLEQQGYTRFHSESPLRLEVIQDRFRFAATERARAIEALEASLKVGQGHTYIYSVSDEGAVQDCWRYSADLHCAHCNIHYSDPTPSHFSFNSPVGACESCRGFGRVIGIDFGLVIPDENKSLREGAVRPWQTESFKECQDDLNKYAKKRRIRLDVPYRDLSPDEKRWVLEGEEGWKSWSKSWPALWYGVRHYFDWLESKAYKMHIRVLLSKYRAYTTCEACKGARLKPESLLWRLGEEKLNMHDLMLLPVSRVRGFFDEFQPGGELDQATDMLLEEVRSRLGYLCEVGLAYLTLDRQSRTLSGGEVQRINLTTALGTSLVNTLFVLDEPSIGLHPRDMRRVIEVMHHLRDAGNSLVVVEHDPQIMFAADRMLDMGPGPGERGGEIVFYGPAAELRESNTLTAEYLSGRKRADAGLEPRPPAPSTPAIEVVGAAEHNLKGIDLRLPLNHLVCITGVSGSGKSTLIQDVLHPALKKAKGKPTEAPGAHRELRGAELIDEVVFVDQSPIGKSARSNPASYVGAFDALRKLFARAPLAKERNYTAGTFSFNSGDGRCPTCSGSGFEHVEMQFLSDVYLRCPDCDGRRYREETLDVKISGRSIADVLDLTVSEALLYFAYYDDVCKALQPLADVGLEYLKLGQPVPTLSGGEAQRLKLAGFLAEFGKKRNEGGVARSRAKGTLFLFDEPTTGLHFDDIAKLLRSFRKLIDAGHSVTVIEHNLDVMRASDWLIDLGPEGGDEGGEIVAQGTLEDILRDERSHTARALRDYGQAMTAWTPTTSTIKRETAPDVIRIHNAREHNLKSIDVDIPRNRFTVVTGVSGSGKSTLAFDIVFAEGQRRYLESLNAYARQFVQPSSKPDVDAIFGIPPTVAIEQRTSRGGRKSTVATLTEIYHFLRLLFMKLGTQYCPDCNVPIEPQSEERIAARLLRDYKGRRIGLLAPLVVNRKGLYNDLAKWARGKGFTHLRADGEFCPTDKWPKLDRFREHSIELPVADFVVSPANEAELRAALKRALEFGRGTVLVLDGLDQLHDAFSKKKCVELDLPQTVFSTKRACSCCGRSFAELDPRMFSFNSKHGWCPACFGTGAKLQGFKLDEDVSREQEDRLLDTWLDEQGEHEDCPACNGQRLNREALAVRFRKESIAQTTALSIVDLHKRFQAFELNERETAIARDVVAEIRSRLSFLEQVGLAYLTLDRAAPTLSGGEAQRIRLAAQLGSNLRGVCYVLDEPTIGLHPRDNLILLDTLEKLEAKGNTLIVVEHDEETIRRAHHVIDLGPGAGKRGGQITAQGTAEELMRSPNSLTGHFLKNPLKHPIEERRPVGRDTPALKIKGANLHNLKNVDVKVPLNRLVVITGVSGSGKSTLARDVLHDNLAELCAANRFNSGKKKDVPLVGCKDIEGWEQVGRILEVDQTPIGKTPRSCPATYVGFWDAIRRLYAETNEARMRGYDPGRFSFNTPGGRCEGCDGQGMKKIEMNFLPDVKVPCEVCRGQRFNTETLAVLFKGKSIGDVLLMNVDEAVEFFSAHPRIHHALRLLQDVGLGYLTLGQQSPTLSGGEAQRIKLVTELAKVRGDAEQDAAARPGRSGQHKHTLYVLDEPTVGLHMADVEKLIHVLHRLVRAGNSIVLIEHNLDLIAEADWIIDLGPEGGTGGGRLVTQGSPEDIVYEKARSHTAAALAEFMSRFREVTSAGS